MEMIEFLKETELYVGFTFEVIACIAGFIYLRKKRILLPGVKIFVYYLLLVVFFELYAFIPIYAYLRNYEVLSFFKGSPFRRNLWYPNLLRIFTVVCISLVFVRNLRNKLHQRYLKFLLGFFVFFCLISFFTFGEFFHGANYYADILGTFVILICVGFYYMETLKSDEILDFYHDIRFYISVGIVLWGFCVPPLKIYGVFFKLENPYFMEVHTTIMRYSNVVLYSFFTIGFFMDYRAKKSLKTTV